jgi:threonine dehydrogenase-like Zn-dependent dehydrogenase
LSTERQLWFVEKRRVEVRRAAGAGAVGPGQVRVAALASGVSQGTELLLYRGEGPTPFDPSLDAPGAPTYPRRYGYAWVGEIVERGSGVSVPLGTRVFALAPHGDGHVLDATSVRPVGEIPPARAVLAANLETAVNCIWDAGVGLGDEVVVFGGGVVGLLSTWLATKAGARVHVVEPVARRRQVALALGAVDTALPEHADVVIEATGDPAVLDQAILRAGQDARIAVVSFYGARVHPVSLGGEFHRRRLQLLSTQVSCIPPGKSARWSHARRFALVERLLASSELDVLLEPAVSIEQAPAVYARLDAAPGDALQIVYRYR